MTAIWTSAATPTAERITYLEAQLTALQNTLSELNARWRNDRLELATLHQAAAARNARDLARFFIADDQPDHFERLTSADERTDCDDLTYRQLDALLHPSDWG